MPIYVYQVILEDSDEGQIFEVVQKMSDPPLTKHPTTGQPVRRVITAPNINSQYNAGKLSNANLARHGLTKYERAGDGVYEKKAGKGPDTISAD